MWEERVYKQNMHLSPIGGIKIACFLHNGIGVLTAKRTLPHFTLVYVTRGEGRYQDETGIDVKVQAGDAILVHPGLEHWYGPPRGESWDEFYLVFEGPVFDMWRQSGCFDRENPVIPLKPLNFWRDRILQVIGGQQARNDSELLLESIRLQELLADMQQAGETDVSDDIAWLEEAKAAIADHLDIRLAANRMQQSYEGFRKKFRKLAGRSPGQYRTSLLMERACAMLVEPGVLLRDIAEELGYCDEYHFSRQFSRTVGWSPTEYRSRVKRDKRDFDNLGEPEAPYTD